MLCKSTDFLGIGKHCRPLQPGGCNANVSCVIGRGLSFQGCDQSDVDENMQLYECGISFAYLLHVQFVALDLIMSSIPTEVF